jgi:hypothetical protein
MSPNAELETTLSMIASRQIQEGATHAQSVRFIGSVFERNSCSGAAEGLSKATELSGSALKKTKGGEEKIKRGLRDFMNRKGKSRVGNFIDVKMTGFVSMEYQENRSRRMSLRVLSDLKSSQASAIPAELQRMLRPDLPYHWSLWQLDVTV